MNPPIRNVTPPPGGGPRAGTMPPVMDGRRNQIIILAVFVVVLVLLVRACSGRENRYEHIAHEFTQAIQNNDYNAAVKLENSEAGANTTRAKFGHGVDVLAPLGKIRSVKETTASGAPPRGHEFKVTFDKGTVRERFTFDPQDKIFTFNFDQVQTTK